MRMKRHWRELAGGTAALEGRPCPAKQLNHGACRFILAIKIASRIDFIAIRFGKAPQ